MPIDFTRKRHFYFGIAVLSAFMVSSSAVDAQVIGPCIQFLDQNGAPTHEGLKCDFSADSVTVKFFGGGSIRFSVNGVITGNAQPNPPRVHEFTATFTNGTITGFTWKNAGKPQGSPDIPPGATDFHFISESGLNPVTFSTNGERGGTARPPLTTVQIELFLAKQP